MIKGGSTRQESVVNALTKSKYNASYVIIHDCARPLFFNQLIKRIVRLIKTNKFDCIVPYSECSDTALFNELDTSSLFILEFPKVEFFLKIEEGKFNIKDLIFRINNCKNITSCYQVNLKRDKSKYNLIFE
mgnify:CR=1 FL=1